MHCSVFLFGASSLIELGVPAAAAMQRLMSNRQLPAVSIIDAKAIALCEQRPGIGCSSGSRGDRLIVIA